MRLGAKVKEDNSPSNFEKFEKLFAFCLYKLYGFAEVLVER